MKLRKPRKKSKIGRWFLAATGLFLLVGGMIYFPSFAEFLRGIGVGNKAFVQAIELPLEVFGGFLIFLALFARRRAKGIKVSVFLLLVVLSGLLVWHTPNLKSQVSNTIIGWIQSMSEPSASMIVTPTPTLTPKPTQTPIPVVGTAPASTPTPAPTPTATSIPTPTLQELRQYMLQLINRDREAGGLSPVVLGDNPAAQKHAEEMVEYGYLSHWGMNGMKPYMRYTLAGGYNYETENASGIDAPLTPGEQYKKSTPGDLLEEAQVGFMGSPGHRDNILNKWHKKVNLGIACNQYTCSTVQQFEGDYIRFDRLPTIENNVISFSGEFLEGFNLDSVQIWYDLPLQILTPEILNKTYSYSLGKPVAFIRPPAPPGSRYSNLTLPYRYPATAVDPYHIIPSNSDPYTKIWLEWPIVWIDASIWNSLGSSFNVEAVITFGKGVYTVVIWGELGSESVALTRYSIFVE